MQALFVLSYPP